MQNSLGIVPIVIIHRNESSVLEMMLCAIFQNTKHKFVLFVVDNNSNNNELEKLKLMAEKWPIYIIENKKNNWLLGFNVALKHPMWPRFSKYIVLSDADIIVPDLSGACWLNYLVVEMDRYACIGKLGASLRFHDITATELISTVTSREINFRKNPRIGDHYIAPVDTTLAIYRKDVFFQSTFEMKIGHASRVRPYYYVCRTNENFEAQHLGWYSEHRIELSSSALEEKIRCFARYGGYVEPITLAQVRLRLRIYYHIIGKLAKLYWGMGVVFDAAAYCMVNFPRKLNRLQDALR
jgi:hypothetical protein